MGPAMYFCLSYSCHELGSLIVAQQWNWGLSVVTRHWATIEREVTARTHTRATMTSGNISARTT
jgi:hypothetical protein